MRTLQATVSLRVLPRSLWRAISDHQALPDHTSFLREVRVLEQRQGGVGTVRQCTLHSGKSFTERITVWEEERLYCYTPDASEAPFPFRWAEACWGIEAHGQGSLLTYRLQYIPKSRLSDVLTYPLYRTYGIWQIKKMLRSYDDPGPRAQSV